MTDNEELKSNGEVIDEAIAKGPLSAEEAARRAKILLYNSFSSMFLGKMDFLDAQHLAHPETRQIVAVSANMLGLMAQDLGVMPKEDMESRVDKKENV